MFPSTSRLRNFDTVHIGAAMQLSLGVLQELNKGTHSEPCISPQHGKLEPSHEVGTYNSEAQDSYCE
jgi:hypothetical protein